jgi:hypothetical protein
VKCDCPAIINFKWSWDGTSTGLEQKYNITQGRWETVRLDVLMTYLCLEVLFQAPNIPNIIVTCRAEGSKKRASFGLPPPFSPVRKDFPPASELSNITTDHDTVPAKSEPMEVDHPESSDKTEPIKHKFRPWTRTKKSASPVIPFRDDRFPGLFSKGCLFYAGGPGYVRALPIGEEGEVLMVVDGIPTWVKQ